RDWTAINLLLQWINENNPLRQVTAAPGNFNWSNPAAWIDAFPDPARPNGAAPDNTRGSVDINANQAARYYDVTLSNPGTITLDMDPQIDWLSIEGAQSQLVIGGHTLEGLAGNKPSPRLLPTRPAGPPAPPPRARPPPAAGGTVASPAGAGRRGQDAVCHPRHTRRYLGRHRDAGTLWSLDPVCAPDRGRDQRPVRTIHFLPAVGISFAVRAVLRSHFRQCDPDANPVRRRGRTDCEPAGGR